jgi:hypothetical protein
VTVKGASQLGLVTLLHHGMEEGSTGWRACWLHAHGRPRSRPSEDYREMHACVQTPADTERRDMVCCGLLCVICPWGIPEASGEESGVWSLESAAELGWIVFVAEESGWLTDSRAVGRGRGEAISILQSIQSTTRTANHCKISQSCQTCNSCHGGRNMADIHQTRDSSEVSTQERTPCGYRSTSFWSRCLLRHGGPLPLPGRLPEQQAAC